MTGCWDDAEAVESFLIAADFLTRFSDADFLVVGDDFYEPPRLSAH
jgi:hypothetical protein